MDEKLDQALEQAEQILHQCHQHPSDIAAPAMAQTSHCSNESVPWPQELPRWPNPPVPSTGFVSPEHLLVAFVPTGRRAAKAAMAQQNLSAPALGSEPGSRGSGPLWDRQQGMLNGPGEQVLDHKLNVPANVKKIICIFSYFPI